MSNDKTISDTDLLEAYGGAGNLQGLRNVLALASAQPEGPELTEPDDFTQWLKREMPSGTVIGSPEWWAPRIYRAVIAADRARRGGVEAEPESFVNWLCREMPAGTVIGDPRWWASRIYRAARGSAVLENALKNAPPAMPADPRYEHLLELLGAKDHEDAARIIAGHHARELASATVPDALPYWPPCNPGCDPEFNGCRSRYCATLCEPARKAMLAASQQDAAPKCAHDRQVQQLTGDNAIVNFCPECGRNEPVWFPYSDDAQAQEGKS